jgi:predicted molibdopterin-dependent oxidoreductase YjgC
MLVKSVCTYCGCGCRLIYEVKNGKILRIRGDPEDRISEGKPCIKGLTIHEVADKGRYKYPVIRKDRSEKRVSWKRALEYIYENTKDLAPEEVAFYGSGKITNEDNWLILKFAKIVFKTNNTDSCCGRLCHIATVQAMLDCFGNSNLTLMKYVNEIDTLFVIGSNPPVSYPVFFNKLARRKGKVKIISVQPLHNLISHFGDIYAYVEPGSEVVFLNAIANYLIKHKLYAPEAENIEGFEILKRVVKPYDEKLVERICKTPAEDFLRVAEAVGSAKNFGIFHGMGLTQHVNALENLHSLLNIVLLKNGKVLSLRGEINVQGVGDIGFLPHTLPTGGFETIHELEEVWNCKLPLGKGKTLVESLLIDPVEAAFISSFNPAQSMPALKKVHKNLRKMFLVYCDSYESLTGEFADVILPTPALFERRGTVTTGEKLVRLVTPVRKPIGEAMPEWKIYKMLSKIFRKGRYFTYRNEKEIFAEIVRVVPAYRKLDPEKIYSGEDMLADKSIKHKRFMPEKFKGIDEIRSKEYPLILTTFRSRYQFLTGEMTERSETLCKADEGPCLYVNPADAKKLKIKNGEIVRVVSEEDSIKLPVRISEIVPLGVVAARFHYKKFLVNRLFPAKFDEQTHTPNYKCVSVRIEKISKKE